MISDSDPSNATTFARLKFGDKSDKLLFRERIRSSRSTMAEFNRRTRVTPCRSLVKTVTWRAVAALDTFAISYLITGRLAWASSIVGAEVLTKTLAYYAHERAWSRIHWGMSSLQHRTGFCQYLRQRWSAVG